MFHSYYVKYAKIYANLLSLWFNIHIVHPLNNHLLKTYPLIVDCARCDDCGRNVHDYTVPDKLWLSIMGHECGILCYDCFCNRADEKFKFKWRMKLTEKWHYPKP